MAYDPVKAHEYYEQYRKKGKKKGRKKGRGKTTKKSLVGLSTAGLNDSGKMAWALQKEALTAEMNDALSKATSEEEKQQIRADYQNRALKALKKIKSDPANATAKKTKAKTSGGSKSSGSSKSSGGSKSSGASGSSKEGSITVKMPKSSDSKTTVAPTTAGSISTKGTSSGSKSSGTSSGGGKSGGSTGGSDRTAEIKQMQNQVEQLQKRLENGELDNLSEEKRAEVRTQIQTMIDRLRRQMKNG